MDIDVFHQYLAAGDIAVQLRTLSRGETSAAVFDCINHGLATIVNAHGTMAELDGDAVWKLPDEFTDAQLIEALETLWKDAELRRRLGDRGQQIIVEKHNPRRCAGLYHEAIERFSLAASASGTRGLASDIASLNCKLEERDLTDISNAVARNMPRPFRARQLLVDISAVVLRDLRTGIQRVVRGITHELLINPPSGFRVEPVYATKYGSYRYARRFTLDFLNCPRDVLEDELAEFSAGDILIILDYYTIVAEKNRSFYQLLRRRGVQVIFLVHDLLPVVMPQHFREDDSEAHARWLQIVAESDGAVCVTKAVADELSRWIRQNGPTRHRPFKIAWSHSGADINSARTMGLPPDGQAVLDRIRSRASFLTVGTLEPRKGHSQVLRAFDELWQTGVNINLVIVGQRGWMVGDLLKNLHGHPELNKRLFWLEGISDEYLDEIYAACTCLIAASEGEGFGLPLIEAARHKLPIIARDIAVFREVADGHAFYFAGREPTSLASSITEWLALYAAGQHPKSEAMPWITWKQSAERLLEILLKGDWYTTVPSERRRNETTDRILSETTGQVVPKERLPRQLLLDVSETCRTELKTGIERVTRALVLAFLESPPLGFRVEPVYLAQAGGLWHYRAARRFTRDLLGRPSDECNDPLVKPQAGDVLLALDNSGDRIIAAEAAGLYTLLSQSRRFRLFHCI